MPDVQVKHYLLIENIFKTTKYEVSCSFAKKKKPACKRPLTPHHQYKAWLESGRMHMKNVVKYILFTHKRRATVDRPGLYVFVLSASGSRCYVLCSNRRDSMLNPFKLSDAVTLIGDSLSS